MVAVERLVLRAEIGHQSRQIVAHTMGLTTRSVFVRTDELFGLGDLVTLRLSLSRLLPPLMIEARVASTAHDSGPGYLAGVTLAFSTEQALLSRLLSEHDDRTAAEPCRILVVEDSALMRDCMQLSAERYAHRPVRVVVDAAESADHALELLGRERYELLLVDLFLPGAMNGADLVRELRAREHGDMPIIGFSVGGITARDAFLEAGADLFLDKPVVIKDLFATLERLMLMRSAA
ncbi:MAG: response regulator receiver modulated PilZ sensor protein [Myxococcales bacterium]|nr:response regulator receiver modulated PilZ sensor protein [Myxococcales bacterium]